MPSKGREKLSQEKLTNARLQGLGVAFLVACVIFLLGHTVNRDFSFDDAIQLTAFLFALPLSVFLLAILGRAIRYLFAGRSLRMIRNLMLIELRSDENYETLMVLIVVVPVLILVAALV